MTILIKPESETWFEFMNRDRIVKQNTNSTDYEVNTSIWKVWSLHSKNNTGLKNEI